jgi:hypothetical protein
MITRQVAAEGVGRASSWSPTSRRSTRSNAGFAPGVDGPPPRRARPVQRELRESRASPSCLRPDLRRREAPPPQARHVPGPAAARVHQRGGVRGLRRLRRAVELRGRWCRSRPSSAASARSTSRPATRTTPASKGFCPSFVTVHGGTLRAARRRPSPRPSAKPCPSRTCRARPALRHPHHRHRRHRRGHHRRAARHGGAPRGQGG